jgi:glutamate-5-semialdehyde dehydrogenase
MMNLNSVLKKVKKASYQLQVIEESVVNEVLGELADALIAGSADILTANIRDLEKMDHDDPVYDRVELSGELINDIADSIRVIAEYDSPIGEILEERTADNGLKLSKVCVPVGVCGVIFEARPNVIVDVFALCLKSRNACVMKGGSQSEESNLAIMKVIHGVLSKHDLADAAVLLPNDRELVAEMMKADEFIDVIIPRGGAGLIRFVRNNSTVPVIETGAGVVHTYFDEFGDVDMGRKIIYNAKTSRPSVCNALDTLLIHESRVPDLEELCRDLFQEKVEIRADEKAFEALDGHYKFLVKAKAEDFGTEYLSLKMSVKVVGSLDEAISHINEVGTGHSEAIVSKNEENCEKFLKTVDAAAVYVNASTRFTDGGVFGLGAEIGISTQKLHARGPMGIKEITSYKWQIRGVGQVR